jgi:hypothetical protein
MQVGFGRILAVEEQPNAKGSKPNTKVKLELPDPFILVFYV